MDSQSSQAVKADNSSLRETELEAHLNLLHQTSDLTSASFNNASPGSDWSTATPFTVTPLGLDLGQDDGQISLTDPFIMTIADMDHGPLTTAISGDALVKSEPEEGNKRVASTSSDNDSGSPLPKRRRSLVEEEVNHNARSASMHAALEIINQEYNDMQNRHALAVSKNEEMSSKINVLLSVNQTLTLQGVSAEVLSQKNQQITNQIRLIQDLQQYNGSMLSQLQYYDQAIIARDRVLRERHMTIQALQGRVEELERFIQYYPALIKSSDAQIQQQGRKIQELEQQIRESGD
ncbi:hypothetical protein FKW77_003782 [Venturia effusa]|uniref:Uncharacterized protein n=1 Tax=Venturia effusa TaxID=50376 RepID=A0A517LK12_9PEZI|nr:hypothetical protein FKW77_003782 [Venturia effusa]